MNRWGPSRSIWPTLLLLLLCSGLLSPDVPVALASEASSDPVAGAVSSLEQVDFTPPHVPLGDDTDTCAMCHRSHTSASTDTWESADESATKMSSLLVGTGEYDMEMCYTCHGVDWLGSGTDIQTPFQGGSGHALAPEESEFGPSPKECSDCHDSHGTDRTAGGDPYPGLLRSLDASKNAVYAGDEYCITCHSDSRTGTWHGLNVWRTTAHAAMPAPASGTGILCSSCHDPHGSPIAPTIAPRVFPPAAPVTATVGANDRTLCLACHSSAYATWSGSGPYVISSHASSAETVAVPGEWPDTDASRRVGECQTCHNPMGEDDGTGRAFPEMVRAPGASLCYRCHGTAGPSSTDMQSVSATGAVANAIEVAAAFGGASELETYGRVFSYSQDGASAPSRPLLGPRALSIAGAVGPMAAGDIDGDGRAEVLVADTTSGNIDVLSYDPLRGLSNRTGLGVQPIDASAELLAVGDVLLDGSGLPEVVMVDASTGDLWVYRSTGSGLTPVDGPVPVGTVSGMTLGDVTGTGTSDVILTTSGPDDLVVLTEVSGALQATGGPWNMLASPRAPSVGDVWPDGGSEIVVLNAAEPTATVSVFRADGTHLGDFSGGAAAGEVPTASHIADVLPALSGAEVLATYADPSAGSRLVVFPLDPGTGLGTPLAYALGVRSNPADVDAADVDGDGRAEVLVANVGSFTRDSTRQRASLEVLSANTAGDALLVAETMWAGGAELAGGTAAVVAADVGPVGQTGHPVGVVSDTHVSTETVEVARHVECADCHDSHAASSDEASAPLAFGAIQGTWGVAVQNTSPTSLLLVEQQGVRYEYELCLKCHSTWSDLAGSSDLASLVNTQNASVHAVEERSATASISAGSFEPGWDEDSVMYCTTCHGNSDTSEPAGPHRSSVAPILTRPYWGIAPSDSSGLCYQCHRYAVYFTGAEDTPADPKSSFFGSTGNQALHAYHTDTLGFGCASCHVSHGAQTEPHLLSSEVGFTPAANGGSCLTACHGAGGATEAYTRP